MTEMVLFPGLTVASEVPVIFCVESVIVKRHRPTEKGPMASVRTMSSYWPSPVFPPPSSLTAVRFHVLSKREGYSMKALIPLQADVSKEI